MPEGTVDRCHRLQTPSLHLASALEPVLQTVLDEDVDLMDVPQYGQLGLDPTPKLPIEYLLDLEIDDRIVGRD